jgi:hypothetical protein
MAALIGALDNYTSKQIGENGHLENAWSTDVRERILQLSFQFTRTKDYASLAWPTAKLINEIQTEYKNGAILKEVYVEYMVLLYKMIGHTRDIIDGKGEYSLSYMLLNTWASVNLDLAKFALKQFVMNDNPDVHPYGSWKDIKYLYKYSHGTDALVSYGIQLANEQLRRDVESQNPSLLGKWVPREKSQFAGLFSLMATDYFSNYLLTAKTEQAKTKALLKAKMDYRKVISNLNKKLDTTQIKQCACQWINLVPEKQTSITMHKQKQAFLNLKKTGEQRSVLDDRVKCAENFTEYAAKASRNEVKIKGKRIGLNDFTKEALNIITYNKKNGPEAQILNAQWVNNSLQTGALGKMIAMVDVSGSMDGDPMNAAIALGIRIAEKSMLGKRVLTFSASPTWINVEKCDNFVEMVDVIKHDSNWGMNTNFYAALNMILDSIVLNKLKPDDVEDMVLAIFSDMQIDDAHDGKTGNMETMMDRIERRYAEEGTKLWGKPFKAPHILFWNLRSTSGFPALSLQKNASMMSGFSPALLNLFCEQGLTALQSCTPWSLFQKSLDNPRYQVLEDEMRRFLDK